MLRRLRRLSWQDWARWLLFPALVLAARGVGRVAPRATIVSLTFDDANEDQMEAVPLLSRHGLPATFYVISGRVGLNGYLSRGQLSQLRSLGHEIGGHTLTHPDLTTVPPSEARREICDDRARLRGWGFSVEHFAYPFGAYNQTVADIVRGCGYASARTVGALERAGPYPPTRPYALPAPTSVSDTDTVEDLKKKVVDAERTGGWLIFTFHHVCDDCGAYSIAPGLLSDFLAWLAARNRSSLTVQTVGQVLGTAPPQGAAPGLNPADAVRAFPNPWRSDLHAGLPMTLDHLQPRSPLKIFSASGRCLRTLTAGAGAAAWDLKDESGTKVASGLYFFLGTDDRGRVARGTITVIR